MGTPLSQVRYCLNSGTFLGTEFCGRSEAASPSVTLAGEPAVSRISGLSSRHQLQATYKIKQNRFFCIFNHYAKRKTEKKHRRQKCRRRCKRKAPRKLSWFPFYASTFSRRIWTRTRSTLNIPEKRHLFLTFLPLTNYKDNNELHFCVSNYFRISSRTKSTPPATADSRLGIGLSLSQCVLSDLLL